MEGSVVRGMRPDPDRLPNDHFIEWLAEAKQLYHHELPPLAEKNQGSTRAGLRKPWLGPAEGFSKRTIAYGMWQKDPGDSEGSNIDSKSQHANPMQMLSNPTFVGSPANLDGRAQQQPEWQPSKLHLTNPLDPSSARPATLNLGYITPQQNAHYFLLNNPRRLMQAKGLDVQLSPPTAHHDSQHSVQAPTERAPFSGPIHDVSSPKGREEDSPNGPCEFVPVSPYQHLTSKPNEDSANGIQRQYYAPAERTDEGATSEQPHGNSADTPISHGPQNQGHESTDPSSLARPTKRRRQISTPNPLNPTSPQLPTAMRSPSTHSSPRPTPSASSLNPSRFPTPTSLNPEEPTDSPFQLPSHKQSRTTLFIAIPLSTDTVPLKLRSCMTLSSFLTAVLAICAQPGQHNHIISGIRVTFDWKQDKDVDRAILLKQDLPDTFEVLLEIVDGAPCWGEEGGRCGVAVEVVLV
ncbi:hypothetical protein HO133_011090 [Letharia lupina]|uniref:Uncharacterized protein n=1 Tax=Letharia lupina TaxID=560253 RepID=A0A8H6CJ88_9LECA|nr:uncharacterized protein HO133_011090 [Letharia lupina]KAF6224513.1 hypothetical protein HO133_011090 [Letharia lupina]